MDYLFLDVLAGRSFINAMKIKFYMACFIKIQTDNGRCLTCFHFDNCYKQYTNTVYTAVIENGKSKTHLFIF